MITNLTEGNIHKKLWLFSIPMLVSVMFQQIYNIADSMIAGKFVGENALAAVGASYPITMLFIAVAMGCNIGCSVIISQLFGAKEYGHMKTAITTTYISCIVLSVFLTVLGFIFCTPLMKLMKTPENIFVDSRLYLNIYIAGIIFLFLYNVCTGIFNALGDSRTPLYFLIGSSLGNIFLDYLFVTAFEMGIAGVAWATFIAQGISCVLSILTLTFRLKNIKIEKNQQHILFSFFMLKKISVVAIPSVLQQSFISVGNLFIQSIINSFGPAVIAGYSAAIKLNTFAITSFTTLANGLSSFTAQNIGARQLERIKKGFWSGITLAMCIVLPFFIAFFFFCEPLIALFMSNPTESSLAMNTGIEFLHIVSPFYFIISIKLMSDGVLRGSGAMTYFMIATFSDLILRVMLAYILSIFYDITGVWLSWPFGWIIGTVLSFGFYLKGVWKKQIK